MFERYTEDARKIVFFARYEASRLGSLTLEPEHLWLGLLRQTPRQLKRLAPHITLESIHARLQQKSMAERISMTADLPLSDAAKRVLSLSPPEKESLSQSPIKAEDLILALLREEGNAHEQPLA